MNKIKVMNEDLSNKIAAGEVVESLMNVVKELVENSIDADSSNIRIDLYSSGLKEIRVTDDGFGMNKNDAILSLQRHATSKLYTEEDLFNIITLGFRGEALPSIASVSRFSLKTSNGKQGTNIVVDGNKVDVTTSDLRVGTIISVKDIFYNTPARLKYLKSLYTELANIISYVNRMALAYSSIKFVLTNDDKIILNTDGSGNILKVINTIYGLDVCKKMVKFSANNDDYEIVCYFSYPEITRSNRNFITLLVNGRYVKNNNINKKIIEAYHTYLLIGKYPIVVLSITVDPEIIDINVHPSKMEIKFSKEEELLELIYSSLKKNIEKLVLIPEVKYSDLHLSNLEKVSVVNDSVDFKNETVKPKFEELNFEINEDIVNYDDDSSKAKMKKITPIGIIHGTYIVCENEDGMYLIDQHAANERINYEYYKEMLGKSNDNLVDLLVPIKIELSNVEFIKFKENIAVFDNMGFIYEDFGSNTIIIRKHPLFIKKDHAYQYIRKIIEVIINENDFSLEKFNEKIAITLACKMAIKANEYISITDAKSLIERLRQTNSPFTCPHGRPVIITFSNYELEKMFKRVV